MPSSVHPQRFLGLDLSGLWQDISAIWATMQSRAVLRWLLPTVPVGVVRASGSRELWRAGPSGIVAAPGQAKDPSRFEALELPEDLALVRRFSLPMLRGQEIAQAVALDISASSPFTADDVVWGWTQRKGRPGSVEVQVAQASRRQIQAYQESQVTTLRLPAGEPPEVWVIDGAAEPVVLRGFGEDRRLAFAARHRMVALGLALLAIGLAALAASTPVIQKRMRAIQAVQAFDALNKKAEPAVRQRAELVRIADNATALKDVLSQRADPLYVMDLLTQALPDDTSLLGLQVQGNKISINGMTGNAAALMQQLSARPEFKDVKAPVAATRPLGAPKDVFSIELTLVPRSAVGVPASAVAAGSAPMTLSPLGVPMPGAAPVAAPAAAAAAQPAPSSGGASFGGGAAFGGSAAPPSSGGK